MRLRKVKSREYCFISPNTVRYEGYFKIDSINYYFIKDTIIGYCVFSGYEDFKKNKRFNI